MSAQATEHAKLENQRKSTEWGVNFMTNSQSVSTDSTANDRVVCTTDIPQGKAGECTPKQTAAVNTNQSDEQQSEPPNDPPGIGILLREGKDAAVLKTGEESRTDDMACAPTKKLTRFGDAFLQHQKNSTRQRPQKVNGDRNAVQAPHSEHGNTNSDFEYPADLATWLDITRYHDVAYRNSRLSSSKERKLLEEEAARIEKKLAALQQNGQTELDALPSSVHSVTTQNGSVSGLLDTSLGTKTALSTADIAAHGGTKRARSPQSVQMKDNSPYSDNAHNGDSTHRSGASRDDDPPNKRSRVVSSLDHRTVFPGTFLSSSSEASDRLIHESSVEPRPAFCEHPAQHVRKRPESRSSHLPAHKSGIPFKTSFSGCRGRQVKSIPQDTYTVPLRGIRSIDGGRGDVRYFIIKSWNAENIETAMRDSLWSTQQKNERLLANAYRTSCAVVLCFSTNNSKAFQGYALMTSEPKTSLTKPAFCRRLNFVSSSAFTLKWLATVAVQFYHFRQIKNDLKPNNSGTPSAVVFGRDGQEIEPLAGRALCGILDNAQARGGAM